jgi:hypothetical protein
LPPPEVGAYVAAVARLLFLASPHLHGADVHSVQLELRRHGADPGAIDGEYGPSTASAVRLLQRRAGISVDGIVGRQTRDVLAELDKLGHLDRQPAPLPGREPPGLEALAWMAARLGETESPAGSNRCSTTKEFGLVGPWCMEDVSLAFKHGANLILGEQTPPPAGFWSGRGFAYVPSFEAWAHTRGFYRGARVAPAAGDVCTFSFGGSIAVHVAICERYVGGGQFDTLEGNTGLGNDSNGGERMRRRRYVSQLHGVYRITRTPA